MPDGSARDDILFGKWFPPAAAIFPPMPRASSLIARSLEPLLNVLWLLFMVWTAVVAALWISGDQWTSAITNGGLRSAVEVATSAADAVWLVLGAANLYLQLAEMEGLSKARLIGLSIVATAAAIAASSAWSGYPLGSVFYTSRLGWKLGPVPLGWPLLWFITVVGGRELAARLFPRVSHGALAALTGVFAVLTDLNLEPIATKVRLFWFWYEPGTHLLPAPPSWRNYATWFVAAGGLAWLIREQRIATARLASWRPALALIVVNVMLLLGHLRSAWQR